MGGGGVSWLNELVYDHLASKLVDGLVDKLVSSLGS